jgi:hypothetical protein
MGFAAAPAQAATITVTTTADSGAGSLRQAISDAAPGDTITFALPNPSTITLNQQLVIAKNLTIQGPGAAALTISGPSTLSAPTRLFFINPGTTGATSGPPAASPIVTIANLTLANGKAQGTNGNHATGGVWANLGGGGGGGAGMGGAIFSNKSQLTIRNVTFRNNRAQGGTSGGGLQTNNLGSTAGLGGGGMGSPHLSNPHYGVDGGALGGKGGAVADGKLEATYPNGAVGPIGYPGGDGAGGGGGYPEKPSLGGTGGFGGGGGGGGGLWQNSGLTGGVGGQGGFGGGGGGTKYGGGLIALGGAGGQFGGKGGRGGTHGTKGGPGGWLGGGDLCSRRYAHAD